MIKDFFVFTNGVILALLGFIYMGYNRKTEFNMDFDKLVHRIHIGQPPA